MQINNDEATLTAQDLALANAGITANITNTAQARTLRLQWHNLRVRKDKLVIAMYVALWCAFAPTAIYMTFMVCFGHVGGISPIFVVSVLQWVFMFLFIIFAWAVAIGIPVGMRELFWTEWIEITGTLFTNETHWIVAS